MIVTTTATIKQFTGINKNISWETLQPFVRQAEQKFAKPMLGNLYATLELGVANSSLNSEQEELLGYIYPMICYFSLYLGAPTLNIHISELGIQEVRSKEGTSNPSSMARYNEAKASFWKAADDYREFAYLFLQEQQSLFPDWVNSPSYTIYSGLFFRSNTEIREYVGMVSSVSTFLAIKTNIKLAEDRYILPLVSAAQAEQLKKANRENVLTAQEAMLLDKIKSALGWLALYESAPGLRAVIEDGVLFTALPPEKNLAQIMSKEDVEVYRADAFIKGNMYLSQLKEFLDQNAAAYPLYFNSPQYQLRKEEYSLPQNRGKKSFGLY